MAKQHLRASSRWFNLERLDARVLPSAVATSSGGLERVIVRFVDEPAIPAEAEAVVPLGRGYYRVDLRAGVGSTEALRSFAARADVLEAMPDELITVTRAANDPLLSSQWGLVRSSVTQAWSGFTGTGKTIVAVIDTGVDWSHPDIAANIWRNQGEIPGNGIDDDGNGYIDDHRGFNFAANHQNPMDDEGHGTHVVGIIGAIGNNGLGVSGVNWHTQIMPLKFLRSDGTGYTSDAVRALHYAIDHGAKIINLSWGGGSYNPALAQAILHARDQGVIVVAAAGNLGQNSNHTPFYPAAYSAMADNVVVVGASTSADTRASFSNFGSQAVTLFAPGTGIVSLKPNGQYISMSGTSMAAPFVSGAIALLWDRFPTWSYSQVINKLTASTDSISSLTGLARSGGRLNVARLLQVYDPPAATPVPLPPAMPSAPTTPPPTTSPAPKPTPTPPVPTPAPAPSPPSTRTRHASTSPPQNILDFGTASMSVTITSDISVTDIDVGLSLTHGYVGDLSIRLTGPDGTTVLLANRRGGAGNSYAQTLFSDQSRLPITAAQAPFSGTHKPEGSLAVFNGKNARGTWTLTVRDHAYYDTGRLTAFTLFVTGSPMPQNQIVRKQGFIHSPGLAIIAPPVMPVMPLKPVMLQTPVMPLTAHMPFSHLLRAETRLLLGQELTI